MKAELKRAALEILRRLGVDPNRIIPELVSQDTLEKRLSVHVRGIVDEAAKKAVLEALKPWRPDSSQAYRLERKGRLDKGQVERVLQEEGRTPFWVERAWDLMSSDPSLDHLLEITNGVEPSKEFLLEELKHNLYMDKDAEALKELLRTRAIRDLRSAYLYTVRDLIVEGALPITKAEGELGPVRLGEAQTELVLEWWRKHSRLSVIRMRKATEQQRLYRGLITPEEYVRRLTSIGLDKEVVTVEAENIMAQRGVMWEPTG
jgi:hypothetical protein